MHDTCGVDEVDCVQNIVHDDDYVVQAYLESVHVVDDVRQVSLCELHDYKQSGRLVDGRLVFAGDDDVQQFGRVHIVFYDRQLRQN